MGNGNVIENPSSKEHILMKINIVLNAFPSITEFAQSVSSYSSIIIKIHNTSMYHRYSKER